MVTLSSVNCTLNDGTLGIIRQPLPYDGMEGRKMDEPQPRPTLTDAATLQGALVEHLKRSGAICSPNIEAAFRAVPRHLFLPTLAVERVYEDEAITTKHQDGVPISSSSQPAIMAIMLEQLALEPGHRVLEIGAGTGYNAALMAHIVGKAGRVVTLDVDKDIVDGARAHLDAAGFPWVEVVCADGGFGFPDSAPYDRVILTVGANDIVPAWREQLKPDGRLVLPLSLNGPQKAIAFAPQSDHLASRFLCDCGFMPLRGRFAEPDTLVPVGPETGLHLSIRGGTAVPAQTLYDWLLQSAQDHPTGLRVTPQEVWGGLTLWLALHAPGYVSLEAEGAMTDREIVPPLFGYPPPWNTAFTHGIVEQDGLALLMRPPDQAAPLDKRMEPTPFELWVRGFGPGDAAHHLLEQTRAWHATGRPDSAGLRVRAYRPDSGYMPRPGEVAFAKPHSIFVVDWPEHKAQQP